MRSEIRAQQRAESRRRRLVVAGPVGLSFVVAGCLALWSLGSPPRGSVFLSTVRPTQSNGGSGYLFGGASTPTESAPTVASTPVTWATAPASVTPTPTSPSSTSPRPASTTTPTATTTSPSPSKSTTTKGKRPRPKGPPTTKG